MIEVSMLPENEIICGDCLEVMKDWPDGCVSMCVTSPPYWGLRDYGTATWEGGDAECEHKGARINPLAVGGFTGERLRKEGGSETEKYLSYKDMCPDCGAKKIDKQLGLEKTPEEYVAKIVEIFREVRRVLADYGTLWLNLGDSYNTSGGTGANRYFDGRKDEFGPGNKPKGDKRGAIPGLKPKDLCGIPWRVAFALQADGWWLRQDIIWHKPNPMPESCRDRCTKAHEYLFLLTKRPKYYYDQEAVREKVGEPTRRQKTYRGGCYTNNTAYDNSYDYSGHDPYSDGEPSLSGRNRRSVWIITTQAYSEAHFATFPEKLVEPCIKAGCPKEVCTACGKPRERIVETMRYKTRPGEETKIAQSRGAKMFKDSDKKGRWDYDADIVGNRDPYRHMSETTTTGWTECICHKPYRPGIVLDIFMGSGTVAQVAARLKRNYVGIELNPEYAEMARKRALQGETGIPVKEQKAGQIPLFLSSVEKKT